MAGAVETRREAMTWIYVFLIHAAFWLLLAAVSIWGWPWWSMAIALPFFVCARVLVQQARRDALRGGQPPAPQGAAVPAAAPPPRTHTVVQQGDVAALTSRHIEWMLLPRARRRRYDAQVDGAVVELEDDSSEAGDRYVLRRDGKWVGEVYRWPALWERPRDPESAQ